MKKFAILASLMLMGASASMAQWSNKQDEYLRVFPEKSLYESDVQIAPNGNAWLFFNYPEDGTIKYAVQLVDSLGNLVFGEEPLVVSQYPTRTYNVVNEYLTVDSEGNAIVVVHDCRYSDSETKAVSYTAYKISQTGEFLWGEDGVALDGEKAHDFSACMATTEIADKSIVFAWQEVDVETYKNVLRMQRISREGEILWDPAEVCVKDPKVDYSYPYLVDGGNNQVLMVYAAGSAKDLYVRKIDFDGASVWSEDTQIYRGGWGNIPLQSVLDVQPSGDNGVIVAWYDDRYFTQVESVYMTYVKTNGEIGFAAGVEGQKLGLAGWRSFRPQCVYDPTSDSFYAIWEESSSNQSWNRIVAQRISKDGELLWGENALELRPLTQVRYGYQSVQLGVPGEVAFFYMENESGTYAGGVKTTATVINVNDTTLRRENDFTACENSTPKQNLRTTPMHDGRYWLAMWSDGNESPKDLVMHRVNNDLTVGLPESNAVEGVQADANTFVALATLVEGEAMFATNFATATQATLAIYDINGALVATPFEGVVAAGKQYIEWNASVPAGIYLATLTSAQGVETVKVLVK
ncbi:MAG: T9SS type A sorting domain-containing protein [Muribaculaceae bacterium]|nr:T9SS type A sorting domain-containing protein [Muribaculaceae bacterium]